MSTILALTLLIPQAQAPRPHLPSRHLPAQRTLLELQFPRPELLVAHASRLFQVGVFDVERVQAALETIGGQNRGFGKLLGRRGQLARFFTGFDRGLTVASVFAPGAKKASGIVEPWVCLIGAASKGARLRGHPDLLLSIVDRGKPLVIERRPVLDSPVPIRWIHTGEWEIDWENEETRQDYLNDVCLFDAYKSRMAAFAFQTRYARRATPKAAVALTGEVLGLTGRPKAKVPFALRDGYDDLVRVRYTPGALIPFAQDERNKEQTALLGSRVIDSLTGAIRTDGERIVETLDLALVAGRESLFDALAYGKPKGLAEVAVMLPPDTMLAIHASIDGKVISDHVRSFFTSLAGFFSLNHETLDTFFTDTRRVLGLPRFKAKAQDHRVGLDGLADVTFAVVPGAAASPIPEAVVFVHVGQADPTEAMLRRVAELLGADVGADPGEAAKKIRTSGKGDNAVRYLALKDFGGAEFWTLFFGGGFIAARKAGDYFVIGFNPRTLQRLGRVDAAKSLATRASFARVFKPGAGRSLECFADTRGLASSLRKYDNFLPLLSVMRDGGDGKLPRIQDLLPLLHEESFRVDKTATGHVFVHEGGTFLSPIAWTAVGYGAYVLSVVETLVGK